MAIRRLAFALAGLALIATPLFVRTAVLGYNRRAYTPPDIPAFSVAATPVPTVTPASASSTVESMTHELRPGSVIVDLAHGARVTRSQFEPLAAALAEHGVGLRFWMSGVDPMTVTSFLKYPDQSDELETLLRGASALVVVSPFFMWSPDEIAMAEQFVADGGRMLLISDPDVPGDLAQDVNGLGEPFGVVFVGDYLYDTIENDGNYVHVYQAEFLQDAASLSGSQIAFYGTRSIKGDVTPLVISADTTLSNLRKGSNRFNTVVQAGLASRGTLGGVMAMGDFDVLTAPFVDRQDNGKLTEFVAAFLAGGERRQAVTDFPAYLGKNVKLVLANGTAVDSQTLVEGSKLQASLERTGRNFSVGGTGMLSASLANNYAYFVNEPETDLIVLADYETADTELTLLSDIGFALMEVTSTSTPVDDGAANTATTLATPASPAVQTEVADQVTPTATTTPAPTVSATPAPFGASTASPETTPNGIPSVAPTATPTAVLYLDAEDGLRLVAAETVLIAQQELEDGRRVVTVLGYDTDGIRSGIERLLAANYDGCVTSLDLAICTGPKGGSGATDGSNEIATPTPEPTKSAVSQGEAARDKLIMVIDDDDVALPGEESEADIYLKALTSQGYGPTLWTTSGDGQPELADLLGYDWVIWSSGGYESGGPGLSDLDAVLGYVNVGGSLTISSRKPFFGMSVKEPSVIADVMVEADLPAMVQGLPSTAVSLESGLPPVTPLEIGDEHAGAKVILVRGPESDDAGAPLLYVVNDDEGDETTGARLMIIGMSLTWLPDDYSSQLVQNSTKYMLEE